MVRDAERSRLTRGCSRQGPRCRLVALANAARGRGYTAGRCTKRALQLNSRLVRRADMHATPIRTTDLFVAVALCAIDPSAEETP